MTSAIITKDNLSEFLPHGSQDYFIKQLEGFCNIVPEFTYLPIFNVIDGLLCYDNNHFFEHDDKVGIFKVRFRPSCFAFNENINNFDSIEVDCESFGIKKYTYRKTCKMAGVPEGYISEAEQQRIKEEEQQIIKEAEQQRIEYIKAECLKLKADLKLLEAELK